MESLSPLSTIPPSQASQVDSNSLQDVELDSFLKLMIAELQNQDPLDPMDNSELCRPPWTQHACNKFKKSCKQHSKSVSQKNPVLDFTAWSKPNQSWLDRQRNNEAFRLTNRQTRSDGEMRNGKGAISF